MDAATCRLRCDKHHARCARERLHAVMGCHSWSSPGKKVATERYDVSRTYADYRGHDQQPAEAKHGVRQCDLVGSLVHPCLRVLSFSRCSLASSGEFDATTGWVIGCVQYGDEGALTSQEFEREKAKGLGEPCPLWPRMRRSTTQTCQAGRRPKRSLAQYAKLVRYRPVIGRSRINVGLSGAAFLHRLHSLVGRHLCRTPVHNVQHSETARRNDAEAVSTLDTP